MNYDDLPDSISKLTWTDPATGLTCDAVRHPEMGHWCGYVAVPADHP